ncbi:MAG: 4Fe-4S binding protein [Bryobacteraceae bacterium]|nr:4Fe-4S binding protein [Bryobacteraceae bacterium]
MASPEPAVRAKKKLLRRRRPDRSQALRRIVQCLFAALNVWIGVEFYLFVRHYETGGTSLYVPRPPGVEGWLPIASLMNLKYWLETGEVPAIHPAGMFLLVAFLAISWLLRKSFCSWLCPIGALSEALWRAGRSIFGRNFRLPRWLDFPLRSVKYVLLGLFLYAIGTMSAPAIRAFMESPYGLIADVKMLNFFRYLSVTAAVTLGVLAVASVLLQNFWCRYLCPYGALLGLLSRFSPAYVRREPHLCIDCAKCAQACPSWLPVDQLVSVRSEECIGCMACVAACPAEGALYLSLPRRRRLPAWALAAGIAAIFFAVVSYARWAGYWRTDLPSQVYFELIPRAHEFSHP